MPYCLKLELNFLVINQKVVNLTISAFSNLLRSINNIYLLIKLTSTLNVVQKTKPL